MSRKIILLLWVTILFAATSGAADKRFTLVIDAGHGGHDAGALGSFSKEKNINLNVALAFGRYVERNCPDVRVIYTRKKDVFIPLHERANIANRNKADLFISIHTNALPGGKKTRGLETYTLGMHRASDNFDVAKRENAVILFEKDYKQHYEGFDPNSSESYIMFEFLQDKYMAQSVELAKCVQKRACASANRPNKGVKQAGFLVLRETSMPSCLIELGFITTPDEESFLNTNNGTDALGQGIYQAFMDYRSKYDKRITVPYKAETKQEINIPEVVDTPTKRKSRRERKKEEEQQDTGSSIAQELANARTQNVEVDKDDKDKSNADTSKEDRRQKEPDRMVKKPADESNSSKTADTDNSTNEPVFKIQILASSKNLSPSSQLFKGLDNIDCYEENGMYKYTYGASTNYNEIYRLRKSILEKFSEAFIIAFKGGQKANVIEAIREFKQNRNKR